ncbi:MAG: DUF4340 domain-containing protein [Bacteroidales bacterium]
MFRKFNLRILLGVLVVLLAVVIVAKTVESRKGDSSFRTDLLGFDTAGISSVVISQGTGTPKILSLERKSTGWEVKQDQKSYRTNEAQVLSLIDQLSGMKIENIVAKSRDRWKDFQVTDSAGTFILVKKGNKTLAHLVLGKFSWKPSNNPYNQQGIINSYVRQAGEEETYTVNGFLQTIVSTDPSVYRDRTMLKFEKEAVTGVQFNYPDSSFNLVNVQGKWNLNGSMADSAKTEEYLNNLMRLNGISFAPELPAGVKPIFVVTVQQIAGPPMVLEAYTTAVDGEYVLTSGMNPGSYFTSSNDLMNRIFKGRNWFAAKK